ncbi:MAG: leucyl aminopeptidase, partial [Planctomycetota bacterium]|nr:leucyl aminopeptidase [Planctomycetota bacterium]
MKTQVIPEAKAGRNCLTALILPVGAKPSLPSTAPEVSSWKVDFGTKAGKSVLLRGKGGQRWLLMRVAKKPDANEVRQAAGKARTQAESMERSALSFDLSSLPNDSGLARAVADGAGMAQYDPGLLKSDRKKPNVKQITLGGIGAALKTRKAVKAGALGALGNLAAREVQNLPSNVLTPKDFAARARKLCRSNPKLSCKVLGRKKMEELKMGALLGVARGSHKEPQLVHMVFKPKTKSKGKIAVVGKGLIFDAGGISLKPSAGMWDMKFDMSGAGAVFGLFSALAKGADCPYEVHGIMACVENMPGGNAQNPGDIVTAMNGKTIEVLNTDAEGRLVLADALTYTARKIKPERIYDLATLTGAAIHALGHNASAVLGNHDKYIDGVLAAGEVVDERCWQLPLWEVHKDLAKGTYADLQNIYAAGEGAGTIAGASFLSHFVDDVPWVHLDIAATAWVGPSK